jgi:membrane protein DedA with SNARE-associated domain
MTITTRRRVGGILSGLAILFLLFDSMGKLAKAQAVIEATIQLATNLRVSAPLFSHILFPIYVAVLIWGGIYLREDRLREVLPLRR